MVKINFKYLKDLTRENLFSVGLIVVLIFTSVYFVFRLSFIEQRIKELRREISFLAENLIALPGWEYPINEIEIPFFSTTGKIKEVRKDRVIVLGYAVMFADGESRELTLLFTPHTLVSKAGESYEGLEGLEHLRPGMEIFIESNENLLVKTEFEAVSIEVSEL